MLFRCTENPPENTISTPAALRVSAVASAYTENSSFPYTRRPPVIKCYGCRTREADEANLTRISARKTRKSLNADDRKTSGWGGLGGVALIMAVFRRDVFRPSNVSALRWR